MKRLTLLILVSLLILSINSFSQVEKDKSVKQIKPALLVIDIQNAFIRAVSEQEKRTAFYFTNSLIDLFHENGYPVINIYHHDKKTGPHPGEDAFEYPVVIKVDKNDPRIIKTYSDSFNKTELDKILKESGSNTLFVTGYNAVACVLSTCVGAMNHDYNVFMVKNAIMSHNPEYTDDIEKIYEALSWEAVKLMVETAK